MALVNYTLAINLSEDWTNRTLEPVSTQRTSGQPLPVYFGSLWWDDQHRTIYQFGGERPFGLPLSVDSSDESIWGFNPDEKGGGNWNQYIGIRANAPWTQGLVHPTHGFSGSTDRSGYFFGGIATGDSDNHFKVGDEVALPGFVTFDFNTYTLENSTNAPDTFQNLRTYIASGKIVSVPYPGTQGLLLIFPNPAQLGFNNITIFDIAGQRWLWQTAAGVEDGDVPSVRTAFCVVWVQGNSQDTSEMWVCFFKVVAIIIPVGRSATEFRIKAGIMSGFVMVIACSWYVTTDQVISSPCNLRLMQCIDTSMEGMMALPAPAFRVLMPCQIPISTFSHYQHSGGSEQGALHPICEATTPVMQRAITRWSLLADGTAVNMITALIRRLILGTNKSTSSTWALYIGEIATIHRQTNTRHRPL